MNGVCVPTCNSGYHYDSVNKTCVPDVLAGTGCTPNCPAPNTINCGTVGGGRDGCRSSCNVAGTFCSSGICQNGVCVIADTVAPTVTVSYTNGKIYATTSEKATCRYATSNIAYTSMSSMTCSVAECTEHVKTIALSGVNVYVKCRDAAGNEGTNSVNIPSQVSCKTTGDTCNPGDSLCNSNLWCDPSTTKVCPVKSRWGGVACRFSSECSNICPWKPDQTAFWLNINKCLSSKKACCEVNYGSVVTTDWCDVTEIK